MDWSQLLGAEDGDRTDVGRAFDTLLQDLRAAAHAPCEPAPQLEAGAQALLAVMTFLNTHPVVASEQLMAPVAAMLAAAIEARSGGKPALFFKQPSIGHRPPSPRLDAVRGVVAYCIELLVDTKLMRRGAAAEFVANEANRLGLRGANNKPITAAMANSFRDNSGGVLPPGADVSFRLLMARRAAARVGLPSTLAEGQAEVRETLARMAKASGPQLS